MSEANFNWKRSALVCVTASFFCAYQFFLQGAPALMVPELVSSFGLSMAQIGYLSSIFLYAYMLLQIPGGFIADRMDLRWLLVVCFSLLALGCYWFSVADSYYSAAMARALMGVATAPSIAMAMVLVSRWFPALWFPVIAALVETIVMSGGGLGPLLIPELMKVLGWREVMQYLAVIGVILAVLCLCVVRNSPEPLPQPTQQESEASLPGSMSLFRKKDFWLCCIYSFGTFAVLVCFGGLWGVPFLCERYPEHHHHATGIVSIMFAGAATGVPVMGFLGSTTGLYRQLMRLTAFLCLGCSLTAIYCDCSLPVMTLLTFLAGFCSGGYLLAFAVVKQVCNKGNEGLAMASVNAFTLLGGPVMQPLVGELLQRSCETNGSVMAVADYQSALIPVIIVQVIAFVVTFFFGNINTKGTGKHSRVYPDRADSAAS